MTATLTDFEHVLESHADCAEIFLKPLRDVHELSFGVLLSLSTWLTSQPIETLTILLQALLRLSSLTNFIELPEELKPATAILFERNFKLLAPPK